MRHHYFDNHSELVKKPGAYFGAMRESLETKTIEHRNLTPAVSKCCGELHEFSLMITKAKKTQRISEIPMKPSILQAAKRLLLEKSYHILAKISLSDSKVKDRIDEMAKDIKTQMVEKVKSSSVFAIQHDETTEISQRSQLLVYTQFIWKVCGKGHVLLSFGV